MANTAKQTATSTPNPAAERAMVRLRQLAKEERAAVAAGDVEALCRVTALLPAAMAHLERSGPLPVAGLSAAIEEIQASHAAAEAFLVERMQKTRATLRQFASARRVMRGYAPKRARTGRRLDERG